MKGSVKYIMKRIILVLFISFFSIMLLSCKKNTEPTETKNLEIDDEPIETKTQETTSKDIKNVRAKYIDNIYINYHASFEDILNSGGYAGEGMEIVNQAINHINELDNEKDINNCCNDCLKKLSEMCSIILKTKEDEKVNALTKISQKFTSGTGTEKDPFIIDTPKKLLYLSKETYEGNSEGVYYALGCDIDLQDMMWFPIGNASYYYITKDDSYEFEYSFKGFFDGRGYVIKNLKIKDTDYYYSTRESDFVGLFGANSGTIKNVGLVDFIIDIDCSFELGHYLSQSIGTICATNEGVISNCYSIGKINFYYDGYGWDCVEPDVFVIGKLTGMNLKKGTINSCLAIVDLNIDIESEFESYASQISFGGGSFNNCLVIGEYILGADCDDKTWIPIESNSYLYDNSFINNSTCTEDDLNNKSFYTDTLGWDEEIWDLEDIIFENGAYVDGHYPKLKNLVD